MKASRADLAQGSTSLLIVRHGETIWGAQNRFAGRTDVPLNLKGERQAIAVGHRLATLRPELVFSSPLQRCRLTAEAIVKAAKVPAGVVIDEGITDGKLGDWAGLTAAQIAEQHPADFQAWRSDVDATPPGGESFTDIRRRVTDAVRRIVDAHRGKVIVLVTHAAPSKMLLVWGLGAATDVAYRTRIDNASVTGILIDDQDNSTVWTVNDTGHLVG